MSSSEGSLVRSRGGEVECVALEKRVRGGAVGDRSGGEGTKRAGTETRAERVLRIVRVRVLHEDISHHHESCLLLV